METGDFCNQIPPYTLRRYCLPTEEVLGIIQATEDASINCTTNYFFPPQDVGIGSLSECIAVVPFRFDVLSVSIDWSTNICDLKYVEAKMYYLIGTGDFCDQISPYILRRDCLPTEEVLEVIQAIEDASTGCTMSYFSPQDTAIEYLTGCIAVVACTIQKFLPTLDTPTLFKLDVLSVSIN